MKAWGVHNKEMNEQQLEGGYISVGWGLGDLTLIGDDRGRMMAALRENLPDAKPGSISSWATTLLLFTYGMEIGDLVVWPDGRKRTLNFGRVVGEYRYHQDKTCHPHRRQVEWLRTDVPRDDFSEAVRKDLSRRTTVFKINESRETLMKFLELPSQ